MKPVILCIMDGYGSRADKHGNAIAAAKKPNLDKYFSEYPLTYIHASGLEVGLPEGQMGNSEVGHCNLGAGRVVYQSLTLINKAVKDGSFYKNQKYLDAFEHVKKNNSTLHIFALLSDGGVHSHVEHVLAIIKMAKMNGLKDLYLHAFMDGRDVDPQSGYSYIKRVEDEMKELNFGHIADISGRYYAMDRDKNLARNDVSYKVMVDHIGDSFTDTKEFFTKSYKELVTQGRDASDEFIIPAYNSLVDGRIKDNDSIIFMNFRPDRAIQISTIFTNPYFYKTSPVNADGSKVFKEYVPEHILKNLFYVCTMKYADSVKGEIAFSLPSNENMLGVYLANNGYTQLRIAETEKYAHVTFFFDGTVNYDGKEKPELKGCRRVLIPSPKVATYDEQPEMSAFKITEALLKELNKKDLDVVILNFANCDMVGHTAVGSAVIKAVETVDTCVGKVIDWAHENNAALIVTADHGNAEEILDVDNRPMTAHTTNLVPLCINIKGLKLMPKGVGKLANVAPTILDLLGAKKPVEMNEESLIISK
ncbi:MAG: 2,3-bisphosphoglycerate-independent phosphoglycerate mutase [Bacilli bacterium]